MHEPGHMSLTSDTPGVSLARLGVGLIADGSKIRCYWDKEWKVPGATHRPPSNEVIGDGDPP
jgi:hypothetical protein